MLKIHQHTHVNGYGELMVPLFVYLSGSSWTLFLFNIFFELTKNVMLCNILEVNNGLWGWRFPINQNVHVSVNMTNSSSLRDASLSINYTSKTIEAGDRKLMLPSSHLWNMKSTINKSSLLEFSPVDRDDVLHKETILIAILIIWSIQCACMQMVDRREGWKPKQVMT